MESQLRPLVGKGRQIQDAKDMQNIVQERTARKGQDPPPYEFLELIGRGSYGRVYKSKHRVTQEICAVKIIEVDAQDYKADIESRDDTIKEFIRETTILQSLKDNRARNVNVIFEAFSVDSQLWIVSEYCPGGSVSTLMKASTPPGLEEQFIIPIAREVAIALKYVHEAGIIHRDIKCANILATEDGRIQLCDFGISGVLENEVSKRSTIVGTPHWMAPELVTHLGSDIHSVRYGTEIDCWAFGCAVYEMATGHPPNSRVRPGDLGMTLHVRAPRLEDDKYSQALRDFVAFCLEQDPDDRPSAQEIMKHAYIANTEEEYPTEGIRKLIVNYAIWEQSGGQRASLFNPYGAPAPDQLSPLDGPEEEWNFSTSVEFDRRISMRLSMAPGGSARDLSNFEKIIEEGRVKRGGAAMDRLFNPNDKRGYTYGDRDSQMSDLPLRNFSDAPAGDRTTMIDLDAAMPMVGDVPSLDFPDVTTIKARKYLRDFDDDDDEMYAQDQQTRRATMDWKPPEPGLEIPEHDPG
ncbi:kinase-like protein [Trichodelitschia bisporula]|uniref:non-specific serine/threonine protein kinase n=1 Tax=Trichodelitschia bisporula TaxID=703511 RepID=A0A6G1HWG8_9PEZI|nr:kinase-like protein [Trichodelitschia bisporula]